MRRILLLLSTLLLGMSWVAAQNSASPGQQGSKSASGAGSATTVQGCLSGSNGKYTLTDAQGKTYDLMGDTSKLADHVGHEVKITGVENSAATSGSSGGAMGNDSSQPTIEVSAVKHVSKTCKNAGGGMSH
jgi:hypothetical protein